MIYAHKTNEIPERVQGLKEHCENTANYALERINTDEFKHTIRLACWLHDIGKLTDNFEKYLNSTVSGQNVKRGSVNHTFAGVIFILEKYHNMGNSKFEKFTSELIAYAIGAHHGLFDAFNIREVNGFEHRLFYDKEIIQYEQVIERLYEDSFSKEQIEAEFQKATLEIESFYNKVVQESKEWYKSEYKNEKYDPRIELHYLWGMLTRMLTSCVMYGDRIDTAEFMQNIRHESKLVSSTFWEKQLRFMENLLLKKQAEADKNQINVERQLISNECKAFARNGNGIYKLSVQTGAGKTLSTMRYSYTIANMEKKQRVIFVIPLLSVLEQNAEEIKKYTKTEEAIGEYHSNIVQTTDTEERLNQSQLLTDFWNEPIIITTLYQLLMNMFSEKTSYVMEFSALANSVIVIDEAQSIPLRNTHIFDMAVNFLNNYFHTTIVLCSATQPAFENGIYPIRYTEPVQMIRQTDERKNVFKRVNVRNIATSSGMTNTEIVEFCMDKIERIHSLLIICNTKKQAKSLYQSLRYNASEELHIFHLSTAMCLQHRRDVLQEINECLKAASEQKVICISTQLVEAGIDFSFESVIRSLAGIDNIVQAFGRCNRSFEYGKTCDAYIVKMQEEDLARLPEIKEAQKSAESLLEAYKNHPERFDFDILSDKSIQFYYESLFCSYLQDKKLDYEVSISEVQTETTILNLLSTNFQVRKKSDFFTQQAFLTAGKCYQVFNSECMDVITPYKEGKEIIADLCSEKARYDLAYLKKKLNEAKNYSIRIWKNKLSNWIDNGAIIPVYENNNRQALFYELSDQYYTEIGFDEDNYIF